VRQRAAAGTDGDDVDHRQPERPVADMTVGREARPAIIDQADVGRGAADIDADEIAQPALSPMNAAPTAPAAGPDSAVSTGERRTVRTLVAPPLDFISSNDAAMSCSARRRPSRSI